MKNKIIIPIYVFEITKDCVMRLVKTCTSIEDAAKARPLNGVIYVNCLPQRIS